MTKTARRARRTVELDENGVVDFGLQAGKTMFGSTLADLIGTETAPEVDAEEMLQEAAVATALGAFYEANERAKSADKDKRKHRKVFESLPARVYGIWRLAWRPTARQVPDMEAIAADYLKHGLGDVPMKNCADSLEVTKA